MLAHFAGEALFDPQVRTLMQCTRVSVDPQMAARDDRSFGASVSVLFDDGSDVSQVLMRYLR